MKNWIWFRSGERLCQHENYGPTAACGKKRRTAEDWHTVRLVPPLPQGWGQNHSWVWHKPESLLLQCLFWTSSSPSLNSIKWQKGWANASMMILLQISTWYWSPRTEITQQSQRNGFSQLLGCWTQHFAVMFPRCSYSVFEAFAIPTAKHFSQRKGRKEMKGLGILNGGNIRARI